jgi:hypothetical protein
MPLLLRPPALWVPPLRPALHPRTRQRAITHHSQFPRQGRSIWSVVDCSTLRPTPINHCCCGFGRRFEASVTEKPLRSRRQRNAGEIRSTCSGWPGRDQPVTTSLSWAAIGSPSPTSMTPPVRSLPTLASLEIPPLALFTPTAPMRS